MKFHVFEVIHDELELTFKQYTAGDLCTIPARKLYIQKSVVASQPMKN